MSTDKGKVVIPKAMNNEHRAVLVSEVVLREWLEAMSARQGLAYVLDWREPHTETVTYYEPTITAVIES